jgi:photosystem II stability/assembly factor-like uncharacterized protein
MRRTKIPAVLLISLALASAAFGQAPRNRWAPFGPGGGTPQGLAIDPRNPSVVYAAAGTVYRSADRGETWTSLVGPAFTAVAVDPANSKAIYAGGRQIARSLDGGRTWETTYSTTVDVSALAVVPGKPSTVLAASGFQLLRSADGGRTWSARSVNVSVVSVAADPNSPRTAYYTDALGLFKSTDAGKSWSFSGPTANGRPVPFGRIALSPGVIYVNTFSGVFRSNDGARSWRRTGTAPADEILEKAFLVDPRSPAKLYLAGFSGIFGSTDAGATWERLDGGLPRLPFDEILSAFSLAADPSRPGFLYAGTYEHGVAKSENGGERWHIGVEPGLSRGPVALFKIHPGRPDTIYAGLATQGDRAFRSTDGGRTWQGFARRITRDGLRDLGFDPADPDMLYAANGQGLWKSRNGGGAWERLDPSPFFRVAVSTPGTLLASKECGLSRSTDDGHTWTTVIPCNLPANEDFTVVTVDLRVDPEAPRNLYALTAAINGTSGNDRFLLRSTDGGATWKDLGVSANTFAVAPSDFRTLYAVDLGTGQILRSRDGGDSWQIVHQHPPSPDFYTALAVDATDPDTLYVGTGQQGVLRSRDGGVTLTPIGGLFEGSRRVVELLVTDRNQPGILYAAPLNGGLFFGRFE